MKIKSGFSICSICLREVELTFEHTIPESLGGFLESDTQCAECNNDTLGSKLIANAKKTFTIRLAIRELKNELPKLFNVIEEGQKYIAETSDNSRAKAFFKKGEIISKAGIGVNGELVVDRKDSEKSLRKQLEKAGHSSESINQKISEFEKLDIDQSYNISESMRVVKRKFNSIFPMADKVEMDERIITLIAYNYLCLVASEIVFDEYFNEIRTFIKEGIETKRISVENYPYTSTYKAYHKIYLESFEDFTKITIIFFGSIVYEVSLLKLKIVTEDNLILIQDLKEKHILFAYSFESAKNGEIKQI